MKNFYLISRSNSPLHEKYTTLVRDYINSHGGICVTYKEYCPDNNDSFISIPKDTECVISVGGDGTVVSVAHSIVPSNTPIIGLNCGHLGYLCDMTLDNVEHCLDMLLTDAFKLENRMMLEGGIVSSDENIIYSALNDVVIRSTDAGSSVISLTVSVNGIKLYSHDCDGLIVSTPTGSTAYNLSANGPIVSPHAKCIILSPINPHTLNSRSIILDENDVVEVSINGRRKEEETAYVLFDGLNRGLLHKGEILRITKASKTTRMVMLENVNFLERMRARMQEI